MPIDPERVIWPFGKYKGAALDDQEVLPTSYLEWISCEEWFIRKFPDLLDEVNEEIKFRKRWA